MEQIWGSYKGIYITEEKEILHWFRTHKDKLDWGNVYFEDKNIKSWYRNKLIVLKLLKNLVYLKEISKQTYDCNKEIIKDFIQNLNLKHRLGVLR